MSVQSTLVNPLTYLNACFSMTKQAEEKSISFNDPFLKVNDPDSLYNIGKRTLEDLGEENIIKNNGPVIYSGDDLELNKDVDHDKVLADAIAAISDLKENPEKEYRQTTIKTTDQVQKDPALAYEIWQTDPSDRNFSNILKSLQPTIKYALAANNSLGDSLIETKAKVLAARAIKKYDGSYGTSLPTFVSRQLQKLTREIRELRNPVKIPERFAYEAASIVKAEEEYKEKYDKEPTLEVLADKTGLSIKQIAKIRSQFLKQISEGNYFTNAGNMEESSEDSSTDVGDLSKNEVNYDDEALEYVYHSLSPRAQKVLEYTTGFGGSDKLTPLEIANKLKISRGQVSRIQGNIAAKVYDIKQSLQSVYS